MANPEHIQWLLEGVEAWNARRINTPFAPDLSGVDIIDAFHQAGKFVEYDEVEEGIFVPIYDNVHLPDTNFIGADLSGANLKGANLTGADLRSANLSNTDLRHSDFTGANLEWAELWKAQLYPDGDGLPHQYYQLPQPQIKDVTDLLLVIRGMQDHYDNLRPTSTLYFRGESKSGWPLSPSIMRDGSLSSHESTLLVELATRRPEEFRSTTSAVEQWVLSQHHGLGTRFLDVTRNPLVSMFNACGGSDSDPAKYKDEVGRLHIFVVPRTLIKPFNSDAISIVANFAKFLNLNRHFS